MPQLIYIAHAAEICMAIRKTMQVCCQSRSLSLNEMLQLS